MPVKSMFSSRQMSGGGRIRAIMPPPVAVLYEIGFIIKLLRQFAQQEVGTFFIGGENS
jgi:hypothetical protein